MKTLKLKYGQDLGFDKAYSLATEEAARHIVDPMALSWLDCRTGKHSPDVDCCHEDGKESWEIYAESRGGSLRIEIGDQYNFIFREGLV
ncbi:AF1514 family protein [Chloroflexota bacterium]